MKEHTYLLVQILRWGIKMQRQHKGGSVLQKRAQQACGAHLSFQHSGASDRKTESLRPAWDI